MNCKNRIYSHLFIFCIFSVSTLYNYIDDDLLIVGPGICQKKGVQQLIISGFHCIKYVLENRIKNKVLVKRHKNLDYSFSNLNYILEQIEMKNKTIGTRHTKLTNILQALKRVLIYFII
jgi:hypothetical protein